MKRNHVLLLAALLVAAAASYLLAVPGDSTRPETKFDTPQLVVHEWGTFTSFSGADGKNLDFLHKDDDLPGFVHYARHNGKAVRFYNMRDPISLETPVLYFYPDRPMTASVTVDFPRGRLTEWYPQAEEGLPVWERAPQRLTWKNIHLRPDATVSTFNPKITDDEDQESPKGANTLLLPDDRSASHYYAARETDAAPLQINVRKSTEQEKFRQFSLIPTALIAEP